MIFLYSDLEEEENLIMGKNNQQIDFIMCINNEQYYEECVRYIQDLAVPEGYSIDILAIQGADSMAQGYNAGMQESNAKYKVYMHQDTFILNTNFLYDIIDVFQSDETIGMMGVIGVDEIPVDANCWTSWNVGNIEASCGRNVITGKCFQIPGQTIEVSAIDGLIMVTQYDVEWREDFLDGWDFYDVSQSLEMKRHGYKVVIPYQKTSWCYHDCGVSKLKDYDKYRKQIIREYPDIFTGTIDEVKAMEKREQVLHLENIRDTLISFLENGEYKELCEITEVVRNAGPLETQSYEIANLMEIFQMEERSLEAKHSEWFCEMTWQQIYEEYRWLRFVLMRIEYGRKDERIEELKLKIKQGSITKDAIRKTANTILKSSSRIYRELLKREKHEALVSVVVMVRNDAKEKIKETLDSVYSQSYQNIEVILEENISSANGKYVALIETGDVWKHDKLEKQIAFMEEHPTYSGCFTWADIINENGETVSEMFLEQYKRFCPDNHGQKYWLEKIRSEGEYFCPGSVCIHRKDINRILRPYVDLWLHLLREEPVYVLQEEMVHWSK